MKAFSIGLTFALVCLVSNSAVADHPAASPGEATGHYDPATGEIEVDVNGVVNWYVEHVGYQSMTGDPPSGLPLAPGLVTDNDTRIGESTFAPFSYELNLGNVAATGLGYNTIYIFWNDSLGSQVESSCITCVPEPSSIATAALAACGLLARKRRQAS